jgi:transcriptional regulator with GAF, ATPase, and Fis domain
MPLLLTSGSALDELGASPTAPHGEPSLLEMPLTAAKRRAASDFERNYLVRVMERAGGSVSEGARRAGLDRTNFRRLLQRHGLR